MTECENLLKLSKEFENFGPQIDDSKGNQDYSISNKNSAERLTHCLIWIIIKYGESFINGN